MIVGGTYDAIRWRLCSVWQCKCVAYDNLHTIAYYRIHTLWMPEELHSPHTRHCWKDCALWAAIVCSHICVLVSPYILHLSKMARHSGACLIRLPTGRQRPFVCHPNSATSPPSLLLITPCHNAYRLLDDNVADTYIICMLGNSHIFVA